MTRRSLTGWGRTAPSVAHVVGAATSDDARRAVTTAGRRGILARGLGRSYGDAAQNGGGVVAELAERSIQLDLASATVTAGAGATLDELIRTLLPQGFFVPVTPGTRQVTVGGAVAADIHGKNHHSDGSWANHVVDLDLVVANGESVTVGPDRDAPLFWATIGGMGLTGVVTACRFRVIPVQSGLMSVDTWRTSDLDETMALMVERDGDYRYTVAWLDATSTGGRLGRGVVTMADHASAQDVAPDLSLEFHESARVGVPPLVPGGLLNAATIRAFNELWYRKSPRQRRGELQGISEFFHPLDMVRDWNRLYGRRGMLQYQFVVPNGSEDTLRRAIERLVAGGAASFLTVLKRFGPSNDGHLSFPFPGWTLTLDIPAGIGGLSDLLDDLDDRLVDVGGRVYLAKDSRLAASNLARMYPRLDEWRAVCERVDPAGVFQSDLSRRLGMRPFTNPSMPLEAR